MARRLPATVRRGAPPGGALGGGRRPPPPPPPPRLAHPLAQLPLHHEVPVDVLADARDLVVGQLPYLRLGRHGGVRANLAGDARPDAEDIAQRNIDALIAGDVHSSYASHAILIALPLLVARVAADHAHHPAAAHDLAVVTATLDRCRYFHGKTLLEAVGNPTPRQVIRGEFYQHAVARQYADEVHPDLAGRVGKDTMPIRQFYTKHRVGQILLDDPFNFYGLFFPHERPGPLFCGACGGHLP